MLDQLNHVQVSTVLPFLPALLEHADFQAGLRDGRQTFQEGMFWEDQGKVWTEDDIIQFLGEECIEQVMGQPALSSLHHLGFAISYLDQALAARAQ